jgi:hypothetical protein
MEETNLISFPSYFLRGTTSLLYNAGKISGFDYNRVVALCI